jgi:3-oxoacyl-[acyl-carrier-protein] synthase II
MSVVITGIGLINGLGADTTTVLGAWTNGGAVATATLPELAGTALADRRVASCAMPAVPGRKLAKYCSPVGVLTLAAADEAARHARIERFDPARVGVFAAAGLTVAEWDQIAVPARLSLDETGSFSVPRLLRDGLESCHPLLSFRLLPNMPACLIAMHRDLRGANAVSAAGPDAGLTALAAAWRAIAEGRCDACLCGAAEHFAHPLAVLHLARSGRLTATTVPASGAAWLVLERADSAARDGMAILRSLPIPPITAPCDPESRLGLLGCAAPITALALACAEPTATTVPAAPRPTITTPIRVAVTGLGAVSALGLNAATTWDALASGHSGIAPITRFNTAGFPVRRAGAIRSALPAVPPNVAAVALRDVKVALAWLAAREALAHAGIARLETDDGLHLGVSLEIFDLADAVAEGGVDLAATVQRVLAGAPSLQTDLDAVGAAVSATWGRPGQLATDCSACAAAALAIGQAFHAVRSGRCRRVLCGGADSLLTPLALGGFHRLGALSADDVDHPCRPFDAARQGTVLGEGAGMLVLERWDDAQRRGADIIGEIRGFGSSLDAANPSAPDPEGRGAQAAMRAALIDAGLTPDDIGACSAHGTGTLRNDEAEAIALRTVFPQWQQLPVSAIKGALGHTIAAAGALQAIACLGTLRDGRLPPTVGLAQVGPGCELDHVTAPGRRHDGRPILANTFGFGGQNACVIYGTGND